MGYKFDVLAFTYLKVVSFSLKPKVQISNSSPKWKIINLIMYPAQNEQNTKNPTVYPKKLFISLFDVHFQLMSTDTALQLKYLWVTLHSIVYL